MRLFTTTKTPKTTLATIIATKTGILLNVKHFPKAFLIVILIEKFKNTPSYLEAWESVKIEVFNFLGDQ